MGDRKLNRYFRNRVFEMRKWPKLTGVNCQIPVKEALSQSLSAILLSSYKLL